MDEKFVQNTERVKKIITELDSQKPDEKRAEKMFKEGNELLDDLVKGLAMRKFKVEELLPKTGEVKAKKTYNCTSCNRSIKQRGRCLPCNMKAKKKKR
tara:strand:+ start:138 stop:431 length:294 start_codon:yes stop_codon:yes gene_type:complete